jgi:hypothetical protein
MRKERQSKSTELVLLMAILVTQTVGIAISSLENRDWTTKQHCRIPLTRFNNFDDNFYSVLARHQDFLMSPFTKFVETKEDDSLSSDDMLKSYRTTQVPLR